MKITWKYRCSICKQLIHPDNMTSHTTIHKASPNWPGVIGYIRVNDA